MFKSKQEVKCLNKIRQAKIRQAKFVPFKKRRILFKAFIESQFKYCPLVWMFHGRQINDKINKLYEKAVRIVYNDTATSLKIYGLKINLSRFIIKIFNY